MLTAKEVLERYRRAEYPEYADVPLTDVNQLSRNGDRPLHIACIHADIEEVLALVRGGAEVNVAGEMGYYPLHYAASQSPEIVEVLLQCGADPACTTEFGDTPLALAESFQSVRAAAILRRHMQKSASSESE